MKRIFTVLWLLLLTVPVDAQTAQRIIGNPTLPATCSAGPNPQVYIDTNATASMQIYVCTATNTWTAQAGGGGGTWGSITGTLSAQTDLQSALDAKVATSRTVSTSSPLGGGGALSSNLTLTCATCTTSSAALTSTALVTGGGSQALQTPAATATMDSSGNVSTPGTVTTGVGGSVAGNIGLGEGTSTAVVADTVQIQGGAAITGWNMVVPTAAGNGFIYNSNSTNVVTQTFVNGEFMLSQTSAVDWDVTTKTALYTVPAGKSLFITRIIVDNASTSLTTASCAFGFNANADDVKASATYTELTTAALNTVVLPKVGAATGAATNVFGTKCTIQQGGAATVRITAFGLLF